MIISTAITRTLKFNYKLLYLFFIIFSFNKTYAGTADTLQRNIDSLQLLLKKYDGIKAEAGIHNAQKADTIKANLLWQLFQNQLSVNISQAIETAKQLQQLSASINYPKGMANALAAQGDVLSNTHKFDESIEINKKALYAYTAIDDSADMRKILYAIAANYQWQGKISEAAPYYTELLKMSESAGDTTFTATSLMCLANIYADLKDYDAAISYNEKAVNLYRSMGDSLYYFFTLNYKAGYLIDATKYGEAGEVIKKLDMLVTHIDNGYVDQNYFSTKAYYQLKTSQYDEAIINFKKAIESTAKGVDLNSSIFYGDLGQCIFKANDAQLIAVGINPSQRIPQAKSNLLKAIQKGKDNSMDQVSLESYNTLSQIYEKENNLAEALRYNKIYTSLKDSVFGNERIAGINGLKLKYETSKKEQEIVLLKSQQENATLVARQNRFINYGLAAALLAIGIITFIIYRQNQKTKTINASLNKAYSDLKNTQQQLIRSEKLAAFGTLATRVAHEIQNPLNFVKNFSELSEELVAEIVEGNTREDREVNSKMLITNLQKITHHGNRADNIVKELLAHTRAGTANEYFEGS